MQRRIFLLLTVVLLLFVPLAVAETQAPKNIILMISDGAGFNTFACAEYYEHGRAGEGVYADFPVKLACSTYMLNSSGKPTGYSPKGTWASFYNTARNPKTKKVVYPATDSGAAATALYTGVKTLSGRICVDKGGRRLRTIAEMAKADGKSAGAISSVQLSHATPAAVAAHNISRGHYAAIAREMIDGKTLDVLMGGGHPEFDVNGKPVPAGKKESAQDRAKRFQFVGGEAFWKALQADPAAKDWTLITTKKQFEDLADGKEVVPRRLLGIAEVKETLQSDRAGKRMGNLNANVPDLPTMTRGALRVLEQNPKGFFLMVEGGAVDWANHDNNLGRMIEEQIDFNHAVQAVVTWIEAHGGWDETLLIVTADHECGFLWGPQAGPPKNFQRPVNQGKGKLPLAKYFYGSHSNLLVPLLAQGAGAERFMKYAKRIDPVYGRYVDNTTVFRVMARALDAAKKAVPVLQK